MRKILSDITTRAQFTRVGRAVVGLNRRRKSRVRHAGHGDKPWRYRFSPALISWAPRFVLIMIVVSVLFTGFTAYKVLSGLNFAPSPFASDAIAPQVAGNETNIMVVGYDISQGYSYVKMLGVLSLNFLEGKNRLVLISPDYSTNVLGKIVRYRNLINYSLQQKKLPIDEMKKSLESLVGLRIDRYVTVDLGGTSDLFQVLGISNYTASDNVIDNDAGNFTSGGNVSQPDIEKYLAADEAGQNQKLLRICKFLKTEFDSSFNVWKYLPVIYSSGSWQEYVNTDISKPEIINWAFALMNSSSLQYIYLGASEAQYIPDSLGGYYLPQILQSDPKIEGLFARSTVVKEQGRVEIYNATTSAGLANTVKRLLSNSGATVVRVGNYPDKVERSMLYVPEIEKYINNINLVREVLRGKVVVVNEAYPYNHTGELVLVIGQDYPI